MANRSSRVIIDLEGESERSSFRDCLTGESAEKLLLAAVLVRAVRDFVIYSRGHSPEEQRIFAAARDWIFEGAVDEDHITSFKNICMVMDLDCERVRARILQMLEEEATQLCHGALVTPV